MSEKRSSFNGLAAAEEAKRQAAWRSRASRKIFVTPSPTRCALQERGAVLRTSRGDLWKGGLRWSAERRARQHSTHLGAGRMMFDKSWLRCPHATKVREDASTWRAK